MAKVPPQTRIEPLNQRTVSLSVARATQYVQDEKIQISRRTITRQQYAGRWPDEYNSFHTAERSSNLYEDPERFFRYMHERPKLFQRKFIFRPKINNGELIRQATIDAFGMIVRKSRDYGVKSGLYQNSFKIELDGRMMDNITQLNAVDNDSVVRIYNVAPYAGTVEKNALYYAGIGGVIYYAARVIRRKYPQLGVRFVYVQANTVQGTYTHYQVPVLSIGNKRRVRDKMKTPGKNYRRRERIRRRG